MKVLSGVSPHTNNDDDVDGDGAFPVLVGTVKNYSTLFKKVCNHVSICKNRIKHNFVSILIRNWYF